MKWLNGVIHKLRVLFAKARVEAEMEEEMRFHIEQDVQRRVHAGMNEVEARRLARARFGGVENIKEQVRDETGVRWIEDTMQDVRYGLRGLRRAPAFTLAALLSLGVGIGANTSAFSVVNGILLNPLPYPAAEDLYYVRVQWEAFSGPLCNADYLALEERTDAFRAVVGYGLYGLVWTTPEGPEVVEGAWTTGGLIEAMGVKPLLGRAFEPDDEFAVLLSSEFWQSRMGGTADVLGMALEFDEQGYTVVGVMPAGFALPGQKAGGVWVVRAISEPPRRGPFYIRVIARAEPGVPFQRMAAQLESIAQVVREAHPSNNEWRYIARPLKRVVVGELGTTLLMLVAVVGCVLLIAVGNVINLMLARGTSREPEVAMRSALGASRGRLVRQFLIESAVLGLLGALVGLGLAWGVTDALVARGASIVPRIEEVRIDYRVLWFTMALGVVAGTVAGTVPAIAMNWRNVDRVLRERGRGGTGPVGGSRIRNALVVAEFATALTVLICSALFLRSLTRLQGADLGVDPKGVVTFRLRLPDDPYDQSEEAEVFFAELERGISAMPGVSGFSISSSLPPNRLTMTNNYTVDGDEPEPGESQPTAAWVIAGAGYFEVLGIPLRLGRSFTRSDRTGEPGVVVVNEAFVRQHYSGRDPIGGRLKSGNWNPEAPWLTIVGVVGDVYYEGADERVQPTVYQPLLQNLGWSSPFVVVRTTGDESAVLGRTRDLVATLDPRMPIRDVATLDQRIGESNALHRFRSLLVSFLALVALTMAGTGIYGVTAYNVGSRKRENAIRRALGAGAGRLVAGVLKEVLGFAAIGAVIGLAGGYAIARIFRSLLFDIGAADLVAYAGATGVLVCFTAAAGLIPSLRASRVDPVTTLREE